MKITLVESGLVGIDYVEPYAGGASVALSLLFEGFVSNIQINDLNRGVYEFWRLATREPDVLCRWIRAVPLTLEEWRKQREAIGDPDCGPEALGFATFYLNRTNRSGIITRGGVIGGTNQKGNWKIDARFNRDGLVDRVEKISRFASRISVTRRDALKLVQVEAKRTDVRFLYLDPPYYVKGANLYDNFYRHDDHLKIAEAIQQLDSPWIVSYDAAPEIFSMYKGVPSRRYVLSYSASAASSGTEVMFSSGRVAIPALDSPARVTSRMVARTLGARGV